MFENWDINLQYDLQTQIRIDWDFNIEMLWFKKEYDWGIFMIPIHLSDEWKEILQKAILESFNIINL